MSESIRIKACWRIADFLKHFILDHLGLLEHVPITIQEGLHIQGVDHTITIYINDVGVW